jgi:DNA-binding NtrC family response regulator
MTDQRMPEMTGVELMGRVRNEHPDAIRIVFTGYADIKAVIEAINNGGLFRYITKPWDPDDLIATLREAAAEYDRHVERRIILNDVYDHVERGRQLAEQLAAQAKTPPEAAEATQFRQTAEQLLQRIQNLTAT